MAFMIIALAALTLTNLPQLTVAMLDRPGLIFSGSVYLEIFQDQLSYQAKILQGFDGAWLYTDRFTTEPHKPGLIYVFYLWLGHLARLLQISPLAVFNLSRLIGGVAMLFALERFIRKMDMPSASRIPAMCLALAGQGLGWIIPGSRLGARPAEFWWTEAYSIQTMMHSPHFALSSALILWALADLHQWCARGAGRGALVRVALFGFALAWVHPRLLAVVCAIAAAVGVTSIYLTQSSWKRWVLGIGIFALAGAGPAIVQLLSLRSDPVLARMAAPDAPAPGLLPFINAYGFLWPLAAVGAINAWRKRAPWAAMLVGWAVAGTLLVYLPVAFQRRLVQGLNFSIGILAGHGLASVIVPWISRALSLTPRGNVAALSVLIAVCCLSAFHQVGRGVKRVTDGAFPVYYVDTRRDAMAWLRDSSRRDDVVLCAEESGMLIPAVAGNRVALGHWAETLDHELKREQVKAFFGKETPDDERREIANRFGADYLLWSAWERSLGGFDPRTSGEWTPAWAQSDLIIFKRGGPGVRAR